MIFIIIECSFFKNSHVFMGMNSLSFKSNYFLTISCILAHCAKKHSSVLFRTLSFTLLPAISQSKYVSALPLHHTFPTYLPSISYLSVPYSLLPHSLPSALFQSLLVKAALIN